MDLQSIYIANGTGIFILVMLHYASRTKILRRHWEDRVYSFMVVGVMVDIDHFKRINDQFGHSEGDRALKTAAGLLKQARRGNEWVFRFAGDEFIVLRLASSADELRPYMEEVGRLLAAYNRDKPPYPLALSYGFSFFDQGSVDAFMKEMDDNMYVMKQAHHRREQ